MRGRRGRQRPGEFRRCCTRGRGLIWCLAATCTSTTCLAGHRCHRVRNPRVTAAPRALSMHSGGCATQARIASCTLAYLPMQLIRIQCDTAHIGDIPWSPQRRVDDLRAGFRTHGRCYQQYGGCLAQKHSVIAWIAALGVELACRVCSLRLNAHTLVYDTDTRASCASTSRVSLYPERVSYPRVVYPSVRIECNEKPASLRAKLSRCPSVCHQTSCRSTAASSGPGPVFVRIRMLSKGHLLARISTS